MEAKRPSKNIDRSSTPLIVVEGMEEIIEKDLGTHKIILERTKLELISYRTAVSTEVNKKRHYIGLIGKGKYNDESMKQAVVQMNINIRHLQDKAELSQRKIEHETLIVDTLTEQLKTQNFNLQALAKYRLEHNE